jgi:hypothetical protein
MKRSKSRDKAVIGYDDLQASLDREDAVLRARREAQAQQPSSSDPIQRCATCGHWPRIRYIAGRDLCIGDGGPGHPYAAVANVGSARPGERIHTAT